MTKPMTLELFNDLMLAEGPWKKRTECDVATYRATVEALEETTKERDIARGCVRELEAQLAHYYEKNLIQAAHIRDAEKDFSERSALLGRANEDLFKKRSRALAEKIKNLQLHRAIQVLSNGGEVAPLDFLISEDDINKLLEDV